MEFRVDPRKDDLERQKLRKAFSESIHDGPIPGSVLTNKLGSLPSERPSQFNDLEQFIDVLFSRLVDPRNAAQLLSLLEAGVPVEMIIETVMQSAVGEGVIDVNMAFLIVPPLTVIIMRMAEAAGVEPKLLSDDDAIPVTEAMLIAGQSGVNSRQVERATKTAEKSIEDTKRMTKKQGLMARPEGLF